MIMKKEPDKMDEESKDSIETYGQTVDFMDKDSIVKIIKYCRE
jgi:hypothetical protein